MLVKLWQHIWFWRFNFERCDEMLGFYHTNYNTVEIQIFDNCKAMLSSKGILENITELPQLMIMASTGSLTGKESVWADLSSIEFGSP